jgi:predicted RNA-binding protein
MCESTVYSLDGIKLMEDVISVKIQGNEIIIADILNQQKKLKGKVVEIDLEKHGIHIDLAE